MIRQSQVPDVDGAPRGKDDMSLPLLSIESWATTRNMGWFDQVELTSETHQLEVSSVVQRPHPQGIFECKG